MRCKEIKSWEFKGLVAAFLDLSVAFSLLCASLFVYLTSKFLGLFGLNLPCPCDGLFSDSSHKSKCFQETLSNLPVKKIASVQRCVRNKTPFDSMMCEEEANGCCVVKKRKGRDVVDDDDDDVSSTPFVEEFENNASGFDLLTSQSRKKGSFKIKSKRLSFFKSPYGLKNYCQSSLGYKKFPQSSTSFIECLNDVDEKCGKALVEDVSLRKSVSLSSVGCEAWEEKTIEILEQVLAEERAARATLAFELEKERNAAASAADEALSMILRLQEEKASIEMEAKQYQRMIEEKSAFDAEEMTILKEILLRREREKHFLEKEVDNYRQMFLDTEPDSKPSQIERSETPQQMTQLWNEMETMDVSSGFEIFTNQMDSRLLGLGNKSVLPGDYDNANCTKTEEVDNDQSKSEGLNDDHKIDKLLIDVEPKEKEERGSSIQESVSRSSNISDSKKLCEESHNIDSPVHDIYIVTNEDNKVQLNVPSDYATGDLKLDRSKSVSDTSYGLPPTCPQGQRNMSPTMRRNSMSAVDYERLKIESEVGLLRGRLRAVQKGREKISFSSKERSKTSRFSEARRSGPLDSSTPSSTMVKAMSMTLDLHSA